MECRNTHIELWCNTNGQTKDELRYGFVTNSCPNFRFWHSTDVLILIYVLHFIHQRFQCKVSWRLYLKNNFSPKWNNIIIDGDVNFLSVFWNKGLHFLASINSIIKHRAITPQRFPSILHIVNYSRAKQARFILNLYAIQIWISS